MSKSNVHLLPYFDELKKARVLVVGDVMHDVFIWGKVKRISPEAPVPVVEVSRETALLGGAANVVNNVLALGARAVMAGVVGRDPAGEAVLRELDRVGADRSCVRRSQTRPTAVKTRIIAHQQQVVRFDREEIRPLKPSTYKSFWRAVRSALDRVDAVIVSDYAKGLVSENLVQDLVRLCKKQGKTLAVDPKPVNADWYAGANVLTPNHREAGQMAGLEITGDETLEKAAANIIARLGCEALLITRGEKGMSLFRPGEKSLHIPALAREVFDVTGAGDTVIGVLATALAAGFGLEDAVKTANLAAGIVVGKLGTSVATVEELRNAVQNKKGR